MKRRACARSSARNFPLRGPRRFWPHSPRPSSKSKKLLRFAHEARVPVVALGAGTGLLGGALPLENDILLVMARFNRIIDIDIDPEAGTARVQPGVRNVVISQASPRTELSAGALHRSVRAQRIFLRLL
jgi:FAD/FMN-containing dehydrogenase